jgi:hypothetical protein
VATSTSFVTRLDGIYLVNDVDPTNVFAMFQIHGAGKIFGCVHVLLQVVLHMLDQGWY